MWGPFTSPAHRGRVVEAKQAVRIVDQHVELLEEILAEDTANGQIGRPEILEIVHQDRLFGDGMEPASSRSS